MDRATLAPGFFQCETQVVTGAAPQNPAAPGGAMRPVYGACGHQYQEGSPASSTQQCSCGMFAVGQCADNGEWVCGTHGARYSDGSFICGTCWAARDQRAAAAKDAGNQELARTALAPTLDVLAQIADGAEQRAVLRSDVRVTGQQLAAFMSARTRPEQVNLLEREQQASRGLFSRRQPDPPWRHAPGWKLMDDRSGDMSKYLLADGRQLVASRRDDRSLFQPSYLGPGLVIEFEELLPLLRLHFAAFRFIDWVIVEGGQPVGLLTGDGRRTSF